ncbi:MAG: hypothetical protein K0S04_3889 [Herbinix sp.]|jgi:hypothetical protein|nr:hypothetical protein [Herbinix sp.]
MKIRRIISCILIITIVFGSIAILSPTKAFAVDNVINVVRDNNGHFIGTKDVKKSIQGYLLQGQVYSLDDGTLLLQTSPDVYEVVQRRTAKLCDNDNINAIMNDTSITQEVKDDILKRSQQQSAINNKMATVDVYIPASSKAMTSSPMATNDNYYTYVAPNGRSYKIKDTVAYYSNLESTECQYVSGPSSGTVSDGIINFIVTVASTNTYVGIFSTGYSILQNFLTALGARTYYGSANDYAWFRVKYDIWTKWTFVDMTGSGGWATGAVTEQVYQKTVTWREYFVTDKGGNSKEDTITYNKIYTSPNYNYPPAIAVQWAGGPGWVENDISMRVGGTLFVY